MEETGTDDATCSAGAEYAGDDMTSEGIDTTEGTAIHSTISRHNSAAETAAV